MGSALAHQWGAPAPVLCNFHPGILCYIGASRMLDHVGILHCKQEYPVSHFAGKRNSGNDRLALFESSNSVYDGVWASFAI